jgi:hypothetical protein
MKAFLEQPGCPRRCFLPLFAHHFLWQFFVYYTMLRAANSKKNLHKFCAEIMQALPDRQTRHR